ncbi:MAG: DUF1624 domain-containing protein [Clostridia bacterium]|nr:DUF1624 domain-containing protein [Clostridia bacterium]
MAEGKKSKSRIFELDLFRGIAVLLMMFDHFMYDLAYLLPALFSDYPRPGFTARLCGTARRYWAWDVRLAVRFFVVFVFLALTGVCCSFSGSNLKRGARLFAVSLGLSAATRLFGRLAGDPEITVIFGVLHCISVTLILVALLEKLSPGKWFYLAAGILCFAVGLVLERNAAPILIGEEGAFRSAFFVALGLRYGGGDSFPLFYGGGQILVGVFLGKQFYADRKSLLFRSYPGGPVALIGRHSLLFYLGHQVLLPLAAGAALLCCGFSLAL